MTTRRHSIFDFYSVLSTPAFQQACINITATYSTRNSIPMYPRRPVPAHPRPSLPNRAPVALGLALLAGLGASLPVQAQESSGAPPLWEIGAFAGAMASPAYPASADRSQNAIVLPFFIYRGEILRADQSGIGARLLHTDRYTVDVGVSGSLPASSNGIALRHDMPDLSTLVEVGPRIKYDVADIAPGQRIYVEVPLRAVLELHSGIQSQGYAIEPKIHYEIHRHADWNFRASAGAYYGDQQLNQYFYGVPAFYATTDRPAYEAQAGWISTRVSLDLSKHLGPDLRVFAYVRHDDYTVSSNRSSPLFAQSSGNTFGMALTWTLGHSEARAPGPRD